MKVVIEKASGKVVYRSIPDFEDGLGIKNAMILTGLPEKSLAEVEMETADWQAQVDSEKPTDYKELYAKASDDKEKLSIIARKLGLE